MKIAAVLFDLDGTLVSSLDAYVDIFCECLRAQDVEPESRDAIRRYLTMPFPHLFESLAAIVDVEQYKRDFEICEAKLHETTGLPLIGEVPDVLAFLRARRIKTGIVSNKAHAGVAEFVGRYELEPMFDVLVGRDDVTAQKPDPEPVHHACALINVAPHEVLFVGDTLMDLSAARDAGATFVGVLSGAADRQTFEKHKADYICSHVGEITTIIDRVNA